MIRTKIVELSGAEAVAYRKREKDGFVIVVKLLGDGTEAGAVLDRETVGLIPQGKVDESIFSPGLFEEALALTDGLPYFQRALPKLGAGQEPAEACPILGGRDYQTFVRAYSLDSGRLDLALLKKDLAAIKEKTGKTGKDAFGELMLAITGRRPEGDATDILTTLIQDASLKPIFD